MGVSLKTTKQTTKSMAYELEKTVLLIKPSGVSRCLIGEIIRRIEKRGLKIVGLKMIQLNEKILSDHYSHITQESFYPSLVKSMMRTPVVACCIEGVEAIHLIREMVGATNGRKALPGTIRGDYSVSGMENVVHASDSPETAIIEMKRFFKAEEILEYAQPGLPFIYADYEIK